MKKRWGVWILLSVALFAAVVIALYPRPRLLMERVRKISDKSDWSMVGAHSTLEYFWLSDHEILFSASGGVSGMLYRLELKSGAKTRLERLESRIVEATGSTSAMATSPDGRWLLWTVDNSYRHAATLDGAQFLTWDTGRQWNAELPCWMPDSRHWIEFAMDPLTQRYTEAHVYDVTAPKEVKAIPLAAPSNRSQRIVAATNEGRLVALPDVGDTSAGNRLFTSVLLYTTKADVGQPKEAALPIPSDATLGDVVVSPDGERVAWIQGRDHPPSRVSLFLHRYLSKIPVDTKHTNEIWVSRVDGTESYEIGHVFGDSSSLVRSLTGLRWLPDSKRLSFQHDTGLYVLSAE